MLCGKLRAIGCLQIDQPDFDDLHEIRYRVAALPIDAKWQWVKEHQLDKGYRKLDWWGQINDYVDSKAKVFLHECSTGPNPRSHYTV